LKKDKKEGEYFLCSCNYCALKVEELPDDEHPFLAVSIWSVKYPILRNHFTWLDQLKLMWEIFRGRIECLGDDLIMLDKVEVSKLYQFIGRFLERN